MSLDEVMKELRTEYVDSIESKFAMYRQMGKLRQAGELQNEFHKLKGTGSTYGFTDISLLGETVETLFMKSPRDGLTELERILQLLENVIVHHRQAKAYDLSRDPSFDQLKAVLLSLS